MRASIFQLTSPERRRALPAGSRVQVLDLGQRYRVTVSSDETRAEKTFSDPAHECERRARFAAVFAVLTLMPPELGDEPENALGAGPNATPGADSDASARARAAAGAQGAANSGPAQHAEAAPKTPPKPPGEPESDAASARDGGESSAQGAGGARGAPNTSVRLELFGVMEQGLGAADSSSPRAFSGELRALYMRGVVAPSLGFQYVAQSELTLSGVRVSTSRLQGSAGARIGTNTGSFAWDGELSALVALHQARGIDAQETGEGNAVAFGLRASGLVSFVKSAVGPVLELHASVFPSPPSVEVLPRGDIGKLPYVWLGGSLGMFLGL